MSSFPAFRLSVLRASVVTPAVRSLKRRAQSMVEAAVVLPFFLGVLLLIFDGARFMLVYTSLANSANSGARMATIEAATDNDIIQAVNNQVAPVNAGGITVTVSPGVRVPSQLVTVDVEADFIFNPLFAAVFQTWNLNNIHIQHRAAMVVE